MVATKSKISATHILTRFTLSPLFKLFQPAPASHTKISVIYLATIPHLLNNYLPHAFTFMFLMALSWRS